MQKFAARAGWVLAGLLGLTLVAAWTGVISAGPLDPPGSPSSTMKTLEEIPGSWSRLLSSTGGCSSERFQCVLNNEAVLDRETGLVWERQPQTNTTDWDSAILDCQNTTHATRMGWRLPTISELMTLADTTQVVTGLPADHPFTLDLNDTFWSSSENTASPISRAMRFDLNGFLSSNEMKSVAYRHWCVRAPAGGDKQ